MIGVLNFCRFVRKNEKDVLLAKAVKIIISCHYESGLLFLCLNDNPINALCHYKSLFIYISS